MTDARPSDADPSAPEPVPAPPGEAMAGFDKKKSIILGIVGLVFIVIIFVTVIPKIGSYSEALDALKGMSLPALIAIVVAVLVYLATYGLPFKAATPGLGYWHSQQLNQAAFAISNGVPAGGAIGLAVQFGMLTSYGITPTVSTAAITVVGLWSTFVTLALPILGVAALVVDGDNGGQYALGAAIGLAILVAAVVVFVLVIRSERLARRLGRWASAVLNWLGRWIHALAGKDLEPAVVKFRSDIYDVVTRRWAAISGAQLAVSITQFLILYVSLRGVQGWESAGTSWLVVFGAFAISQLGLMIPITPGGLGTVDAAMIGLLTTFGVSAGDATAAVLVWRAASYVPQIIIGILALVSWYRRAGQTYAAARPALPDTGTA